MNMKNHLVGLSAIIGLFVGSAFGATLDCEMIVREGVSYRAAILAQPQQAVPTGTSRALHAEGYRAMINLGARDDGKTYIEVAHDVKGFPALSYQLSPSDLSRYAHGTIDRQRKRHITVTCNKSE